MFHPAVNNWFTTTFASATPVQIAAWDAIGKGQDVLIAAPTGSGKTFAAFLCAINDLVERSQQGRLIDGVSVLYVSPLKALSNDIEKNLQHPLAGVDGWLLENGSTRSGIRAMVRTGDTSPGEREHMRRQPPHILVTTPESLYLLLTSASGRHMLASVRDVIVDEIHALAGNKRGSHLSLSLARLDSLLPGRARRIGLSATQKPLERIAGFLTGGGECQIVDSGHQRDRDLQIELPSSPLSAVMANEVWEEIYDRLQQLIEEHRTTLIFVNTRRLAERLARHLAERLGGESVTAHHGSLSRTHRLEAEQALKAGKLRALVATASLELGIDIGHVDLVCQLGSPGSISGLIQRVGRAGHRVGATPKGRLFPLTRDDLVESVALLRAVNSGLLDQVVIPTAPLDVLTQHLVAEVSAREWEEPALFDMVRSAWPYRDLSRQSFDQVVAMLASGYTTRRGRRAAYLHHDAINGRLRARPGARLTALQNGGAIPDQFDYEVILQPQGFRVGTLNEDFAFESLPGDIFQLGNTGYRILKVEQGRVLVEDAHGQPPTIPFWLGDAPGRSDELSAAVSDLCKEMQEKLRELPASAVHDWLQGLGFSLPVAQQTAAYLSAVLDALGCIPTQQQMVLERFFDDTGDMHLVIHAPLGSRIMRAWGLALRKRFCRHFNFELQAAALEDSLILSLGETHSFDNESIPSFLKSSSVRQVLVQALLDAPMFNARWRWNATIALAVQRMRNGQKLPPQWQRNQAEDLVAVVFPDQLACLENIRGEREIPDHPLVTQTINDCLHETMDVAGLEEVLHGLESGRTEILCLDLTAPSPRAAEIINARPYAFLDDGDAENRRTRAISQNNRDLDDAAMLSIISVPAVQQVQAECWIAPRNADELHDGLLECGFLTGHEFTTGCSSAGAAGEAGSWGRWFQALSDDLRACRVSRPDGRQWWVATERLGEFLTLDHHLSYVPDPASVWPVEPVESRERALVELLRSRLACLGPVTLEQLADDLGVAAPDVRHTLLALQQEGYAIRMAPDGQRGAARPAPGQGHELAGAGGAGALWCERRLLARIHRYSRERRRRASQPVSPAAFMRFLVAWHGLEAPAADLGQALDQLEGWVAPLAAWEPALLQTRCRGYTAHMLDQMMLGGELSWFRPAIASSGRQQIVAATPICLVPRQRLKEWWNDGPVETGELPSASEKILDLLQREGASFTSDLQQQAGLLRPQLEQALGTLVARGLVTADAFSPLRWLIRPEALRRRQIRLAKRRPGYSFTDMLGRWSLVRRSEAKSMPPDHDRLATLCAALLRRYGVVFRAVVERETLLPPWRHLLQYLRRMEDRGEVRGGRFVDGFSGEQFALTEAAGLLRRHEQAPQQHQVAVVGATDPLNLGGVITPGAKTPAVFGNRILLCDGIPAARIQGDSFELLNESAGLSPEMMRKRLSTVKEFRHGDLAPAESGGG